MTRAARRAEALALARAVREHGILLRLRTVDRPSSVVANLFFLEGGRPAEFIAALAALGFREAVPEIPPPPGLYGVQLECTTPDRFALLHKVQQLTPPGMERREPPPVPWVER